MPFRIKPSSTSVAVVLMLATSEPEFGSVMAKQPPLFACDQAWQILLLLLSLPNFRRTFWGPFI